MRIVRDKKREREMRILKERVPKARKKGQGSAACVHVFIVFKMNIIYADKIFCIIWVFICIMYVCIYEYQCNDNDDNSVISGITEM